MANPGNNGSFLGHISLYIEPGHLNQHLSSNVLRDALLTVINYLNNITSLLEVGIWPLVPYFPIKGFKELIFIKLKKIK